MSCVMCHGACVMCHKSCVICHVSCVMCHMSQVTCHKSNVTCHISSSKHLPGQTVRARELKLWQKFRFPQSVTCDMSSVMCVTSHVSCVIFKIPSRPNRQSWGVDTWHLTCYMRLFTHDKYTMTPDRLGEVDFPSKFQLPSFHGLAIKLFWRTHETCDT